MKYRVFDTEGQALAAEAQVAWKWGLEANLNGYWEND
jgi:hypothetical protein